MHEVASLPAGMTKTDAAVKTLRDINPDVEYESYHMVGQAVSNRLEPSRTVSNRLQPAPTVSNRLQPSPTVSSCLQRSPTVSHPHPVPLTPHP